MLKVKYFAKCLIQQLSWFSTTELVRPWFEGRDNDENSSYIIDWRVMQIRSDAMRHHVTGVEVIVRIWHCLLLNHCPVVHTWNISSAWCTFGGLSITFLAIHTWNVGISLKGKSKYRRSLNILLILEKKSTPLNGDEQEIWLHELYYGSDFKIKTECSEWGANDCNNSLPLRRLLFALFPFETKFDKV